MSEKVLGSFGCIKRPVTRNYSLYFTQKRVIIAKTGISILWYLLAFIPMFFGGLLLVVTISVNRTSNAIPLYGWFALPLIIGSLVFLEHLLKKKSKKIDKLSPENILANNKKNFQIPYNNITRIEMYPQLWIRNPKIKILTKNGETHEFFIPPNQTIDISKKQLTVLTPKKRFDECVNFVRRVLPGKTIVV